MKLEIERMYLNIIKVIYRPIANIIPNGKNLKPFPLKSGRNEANVSTLSTLIPQFWNF
jgi:hypothetical protein